MRALNVRKLLISDVLENEGSVVVQGLRLDVKCSVVVKQYGYSVPSIGGGSSFEPNGPMEIDSCHIDQNETVYLHTAALVEPLRLELPTLRVSHPDLVKELLEALESIALIEAKRSRDFAWDYEGDDQ